MICVIITLYAKLRKIISCIYSQCTGEDTKNIGKEDNEE